MAIIYGSWIARLPDIQMRLQLSEGEVGIVLMGLAFGTLLATPLTVFILRMMPLGKATFLSTLLLCLAFSTPALATGKWMLTALLALTGLFDGFMNIAMNTAAASIEKRDKVNIMSTCHGMFSVGLILGAASSGYISKLGFSFFWHIVGIALFLIALAMAIRPCVLAVPESTDKETGFVFPSKAILGLGIICACFNIGEGAIADWSAIYLRDYLGSDPFISSLGLAIYDIGMAIGRFSGDKIRAAYKAKTILLIGGLVTILGLIIVVFSTISSMAILGFFLSGLGLSLSVPVLFSEASKVEGIQPSVGLASVATFSLVGFTGGPPLIGFISEYTSLSIGLGFVALLAVLGTLLIMRIL